MDASVAVPAIAAEGRGGPTRARLALAHGLAHLIVNRSRIPQRWAWARRAVALFKLPEDHGLIRCPTVYGFDLYLDKGGSREIYQFGFYEPGTLDVMRRVLRKGDVFLDAGASVGMMSLYASKLVGPAGRVLAFEPLPLRFNLLTRSIEANGADNTKAFNFGLASEARDTRIFLDRPSPSMVEQEGSSETGSPSHVERLDRVLFREGVAQVRMLKIDVEGFEMEVLRGCEDLLRGPRPPVICVEYGVYDRGANDLEGFLRSLPTYKLYQLSKTSRVISRLVEIPPGQSFRPNDNVYAIPSHVELTR